MIARVNQSWRRIPASRKSQVFHAWDTHRTQTLCGIAGEPSYEQRTNNSTLCKKNGCWKFFKSEATQ